MKSNDRPDRARVGASVVQSARHWLEARVMASTQPPPADPDASTPGLHRPADLRVVRLFLLALVALLVGYMFMGRGFAHVGRPPVYIGEVVLFIGLIATALALVRLKPRLHLSPIVWLLLAFMVWGLARTLPYLGIYGFDALRDAVLWGYAIFALMVYVLVDRELVLRAMGVYGGVVPVFAVWLPICYYLFLALGASIDPNELGSDIPLIFFKSGDMSVHIVGSIAFLVLGLGATASARSFIWRPAIVVPLLWTAFVAGASNRGALVSVVIGLSVVAALAILLRRSRNWYPVLGAVPVLAVLLAAPGVSLTSFIAAPTSTPSGMPTSTPTPVTSAAPTLSASARASPSGAPTSQGSAGPTSTSPPGFSTLVLVPNSGFEFGALKVGQIDGWSAGEGSYDIVEGGGYSGDKFALVQATGEPYTAMITSGEFPFQAEDDISVSVWAKALSGSPILEISVQWFDGAGIHLGTSLAGSVRPNGEAWQVGSGILRPPADTTHARILLREATGGGATIGIDEVVVTAGDFLAPPGFAAPSLAANSGFELGALSVGQIDGWAATTGSYNIVGGGGHRGEQFASVHATGEPYSASLTSAGFPFGPEDDISVSVWAKALSGSPILDIYVYWFDRSGAHITTALAGSVMPGGNTTWQEGSGILRPPAETTHARILLREATGGGAMIGIDEVVVTSGDFLARPPPPPPPEGRPATIDQIIENIGSIFSSSSDPGLEGTRSFRLRWWGAIVDYTVFGDYFWTGKGFGVNLADDDGFQGAGDGSLRAPHNSHITALARMGVPGFILWTLLQAGFGIGLLRAVLAHRREGDKSVAAVGAWILAYWVAMMVNTAFDPYLEGPQGGIWFWSLFGLGLVVMRLRPRRIGA